MNRPVSLLEVRGIILAQQGVRLDPSSEQLPLDTSLPSVLSVLSLKGRRSGLEECGEVVTCLLRVGSLRTKPKL